ncbi:hypothetical protein QEN19_000427 [Hanseniaspora menglaensis]
MILLSQLSRHVGFKNSSQPFHLRLLHQNSSLKRIWPVYRSPLRALHISKNVKNLRITKNGEEIVAPIKNIEDIARIPNTDSANISSPPNDELAATFLNSEEQEINFNEEADKTNICSESDTLDNPLVNLANKSEENNLDVNDMLINLQKSIENENMIEASKYIENSFVINIENIMNQLEVLKNKQNIYNESSIIFDFINKGNLLKNYRPTPFTDLNVKEIIDDLTEENIFTKNQAKALAYIMIDNLNKKIYKDYNYNFVNQDEFDKISLLIDNRIQDFKLNKEKKVNAQKQDLDMVFEQLAHLISLVKESSPNLIETDLKRESQIDLKNHQNDINDLFEDLNLQFKNTRYLIAVHVLGGLQVKVDEYRWFTMRLTVTAMGLMVFLLTLIIWTNSAKNKNGKEEVQASVMLKALESEELDEQIIPESLDKTKPLLKDPDVDNNHSAVLEDTLTRPLGASDLLESSISEID